VVVAVAAAAVLVVGGGCDLDEGGRNGEMMELNRARMPRRTSPRGAYWLSAASCVKALFERDIGLIDGFA